MSKKDVPRVAPTSIVLDPALKKRFGIACREREITQTAAIAQAIEEWLDRTGDPSERLINSPSTKDLNHLGDLSQKSAALPSEHGPSAAVSEEQIRQILDEYEARLLERLEAATGNRKTGRTHPKQKAGKGA